MDKPEVPLPQNSVSIPPTAVAPDVYAPGRLGELTEVIDPDLVDAVLDEENVRELRVRLLPARVMVYVVLALACFEQSSYQGVWGKLTTGLHRLTGPNPCASSLSRARRRLGVAPLRRLFTILAGPVATADRSDSLLPRLTCGRLDGTTLVVPDEKAVTWHYPKHIGKDREFGYPLVRLVALVECGTRAILDAGFGPDRIGELSYAHRLLGRLNSSMILLWDAYYDAMSSLTAVSDTGASFLLRSTRKRRPTVRHPLPDGSYLKAVPGRPGIRATARGPGDRSPDHRHPGRRHLPHGTMATADNLLDADRHPAKDLIDLYHRRWQVETSFLSLKSTILDRRVLRSRTVPGLDQEIYALLTVYQLLIRTAGDLTTVHPEVPAHRVSFTVLLQAAADQIIAGPAAPAAGPATLVGAIGRAALVNLQPATRRWRVKARIRKRHSKYSFNRKLHPRTVQTYTLQMQVLEDGTLDSNDNP
jgi:hypothetical protein